MAERIPINFVGREVGIQYHPETSEAAFRDGMIARHRQGISISAALVAIGAEST